MTSRGASLVVWALTVVAAVTSTGCATRYWKEFEGREAEPYGPGSKQDAVDYGRFGDWHVQPLVRTRSWASGSVSEAERAAIDEYEVSFDFAASSGKCNGYAQGTFEVHVDGISITYLPAGSTTPTTVAIGPVVSRPGTRETAGKLRIPDDIENIELTVHYTWLLHTSDQPVAENTFKLKMRRTLSSFSELG